MREQNIQERFNFYLTHLNNGIQLFDCKITENFHIIINKKILNLNKPSIKQRTQEFHVNY